MRHKYIILGLFCLLIILIILKVNEPISYPLSTNYDWGKEAKAERLANKYLEDRLIASDNAIYWDSFHIGDTKEIVDSNAQFTTDTTVVLGGKTFPCNTTFFYNEDKRLIEIHMSFTDYGLSTRSVTEAVLQLYGDHYLKVYKYNSILKRNEHERYFWLDGDNLIFYENYCLTDDGYLCVADISLLSKEQLVNYFLTGHIIDWKPKRPNIVSFYEQDKNRSRTTPSSSSSRTYKYGDSDIYQGSSQQKEDLKAIDDYFGL